MLKTNTRFAIVACLLLVPILLIGAKVCPQCLHFDENELICTGTCSLSMKRHNSPAYDDCAGDTSLYPSDWECLRHNSVTSVVITPYSNTSGVTSTIDCSDCGFVAGDAYPPWELHECYNDDTDCGGSE
jgi:hypothetical protein